jgi:hypothetical protein
LTEPTWEQQDYQVECLPEPTVTPDIRPGDPRCNVVVAVPMERTVMQLAFFGFMEISQRGWPLAKLEYTRNDIARHKFCEFLMSHPEYTHLLMLDSDHVHPPDIVHRLARWCVAYPQEVEVIGGLNFRRGEPYDPCAFVDPGDGHFHRLAEWPQGAVNVSVLGSGSILIAKSALERIPLPWWDYQYPDHNGWPGTDMTFSNRCREEGVKLWCDTTTTSPHIGDRLIGYEDYRRYLAAHGAEMMA